MKIRTKPIPSKLYKYRSLAGESFRYTQSIFARNELHCSSLSAFNDPFEGYFALVMPSHAPEQQRQYGPWANELANRKVQGAASVCAFSEKNDDILMWAHYADSHHGISIEFSPSRSPNMRHDLCDVRYLSMFKEVEHGAVPDDDDLMRLVCTAKARHWGYESEWRIVTNNAGAYKFPASCLTGVILGCRVSPDNERWVRDWIASRKPRPTLYRAVQVDHEFRLNVIECE